MTSHLWAEAEDEHHEKEQRRPEMRDCHPRQRLRVHLKHEARPGGSDLLDGHVLLRGHEAEHREHNPSREHTRERFHEAHDDRVAVHVAAEAVEAREREQNAARHRSRVEHLSGRVTPHLFRKSTVH